MPRSLGALDMCSLYLIITIHHIICAYDINPIQDIRDSTLYSTYILYTVLYVRLLLYLYDMSRTVSHSYYIPYTLCYSE